MAITQKDIEKLSEIFATKADLEKLTEKFATKADLGKYMTKADFEELKYNYLDKIMKKLEDFSTELKLSFSQYQRHDEKLEDHERRIKAVELKV